MKQRKNFLANDGQSTIEFLMSVMFSLGLVYLFILLALNYTSGYLIHYATFMSSRAFMVADNHILGSTNSTDTEAEQAAEQVFAQFELNGAGMRGGDHGNCLHFNHPSVSQYEYVGVRCEWESRMSFMPFMGGKNALNLVSESFLGKSPSISGCALNICHAASGSDVCSGNFITLFDNGC